MGKLTFGRNFWRQTAERAVKTAGQFAVALIPASGLNLLDVDWKVAIGTVAGGALLSIVTSVATASVGAQDDPSAVAPVDEPAATA